MALFKILKGLTGNLPASYVDGYCYFTTNDGKFYIDTSSIASGRLPLNAYKADIFSSPRTIALTGEVIGSISSNGLNGWSIATTIDQKKLCPLVIGTQSAVTGAWTGTVNIDTLVDG